MPAFSRAIDASVSPRYSVWSRPIEVIAVAHGTQVVTASRRPPRPVSSTAISTPGLGHGQEREHRRDLEVGERHLGRDHQPVERGQPTAVGLPPVDTDALREPRQVR